MHTYYICVQVVRFKHTCTPKRTPIAYVGQTGNFCHYIVIIVYNKV